MRANPDGTGKERFIFGQSGRFPVGVAVDDGHIYWANYYPGASTIGRANLDGTAVNRAHITGVSDPTGVAIDDSHLYWANSATDTIGRANLDTMNVDQSFIATGDSPGGVAVNGAHVYWSHFTGGTTIGRANLDGTGVEQSFITGASTPAGVAVDDSHIYWGNYGAGYGQTIGRANLDGTEVDQSFITALRAPMGVAVYSGHIYWTAGTIGRANLDGSGADHSFIDAQPVGGVGYGLAVDALSRPLPPNGFSFGKVDRDESEGTALLPVKASGPGTFKLHKTTRVKALQRTAGGNGKARLRIRPMSPARKRLEDTGKVRVRANVTYTPDGGEPKLKTVLVRLLMRDRSGKN